MPSTSVRHNLFNNNLSKRAASSGPPIQGSSSNNSTVHSSRTGSDSGAGSSESNSSTLNTSNLSDNGEIVVRDKNGDCKLDIPVLPPVVAGEDGDEMEGFEGQNGWGSTVISAGETEIGAREKERIEASLIEMMRRSRNRQMNTEPMEIFNLVQQSLRDKVAALDEDNWMYEPDVDPRT